MIGQNIKNLIKNLNKIDRNSNFSADILTDEELKIVNKIESHGYRKIGSGTSRVVFDLNNGNVLKIARPSLKNYNGIKDNKLEYSNYNEAPSDVRKILAPISKIFLNNKCLVMEKSTDIKGYEHEISEDFINNCNNLNINLNSDTLLWNVGYIPSKNKDCFIDYGSNIL